LGVGSRRSPRQRGPGPSSIGSIRNAGNAGAASLARPGSTHGPNRHIGSAGSKANIPACNPRHQKQSPPPPSHEASATQRCPCRGRTSHRRASRWPTSEGRRRGSSVPDPRRGYDRGACRGAASLGEASDGRLPSRGVRSKPDEGRRRGGRVAGGWMEEAYLSHHPLIERMLGLQQE
jgi:hypothetical protein